MNKFSFVQVLTYCNPRFIDVVLTKKEKEELFESIFKEILQQLPMILGASSKY